jgi:hypothetical protein
MPSLRVVLAILGAGIASSLTDWLFMGDACNRPAHRGLRGQAFRVGSKGVHVGQPNASLRAERFALAARASSLGYFGRLRTPRADEPAWRNTGVVTAESPYSPVPVGAGRIIMYNKDQTPNLGTQTFFRAMLSLQLGRPVDNDCDRGARRLLGNRAHEEALSVGRDDEGAAVLRDALRPDRRFEEGHGKAG